MDNRNDIINNGGNNAENVQNNTAETAEVKAEAGSVQTSAAQENVDSQQAQQPQQAQAQSQQPQPQGEYSWRNPYYNPETHRTAQPAQQGQTAQPSYTFDPRPSASSANQSSSQNTYRNPYSSNGAGFTAYSGRSEYTTGSYSSRNSGYDGVGYTGQKYDPSQITKPVKEKKKTGVSGKVLAAAIAVCVLLSGVVGAGSAYFTSRNIMRNTGGTTYISQPSDNSGEKTGSGLTYQTVPSGNSGTEDSENAIVNAVNKAKDSVVEIKTEAAQYSPWYGEYVAKGAGSGVIISTDGYIITCQHVIDGATSITVTLTDGRKYQATVVGEDEQTDIAVIKIDAQNLVSAVIGDSDTLVVGQTAIAIGNPLGELGGTVTTGIISALDRDVTIDGKKYTLMQTNAAINPGNSGGGLFDINGDLIGIVNAKSSGSEIEGLGFSIPIDKAMKIANDFISEGYVTGRVMLGVQIAEITSSTTQSEIYRNFPDLLNYITDVGVYFIEYSGDQNGEFEYGDRIVGIDGYTVTTLSDIRNVLENYKDGDTVKITVARLETIGRRAQSKMVEFEVTLHENKGQ